MELNEVMSKQRKISAFFGQGQPENNVENAETDEAEPGKDQASEPKAKVAKRNFQDTWLENGWSTIHRRVCSVRVANNQVNPILSPVVA